MKKSLGIYIHIPFCLKKCHYCDFCSFPGTDGTKMNAYTKELCRRMRQAASDCAAYTVDTVYFGGGTPTLLPLFCFETLMGTLRDAFEIDEDAEITAECNPATADLSYLSALRGMGINRLSIGLQSTIDRELRAIGRAHTYADFLRTFGEAREAGFDNISVDLMYALPDQRAEDFRASLRAVVELRPEHISAYGLKIEEDTYFGRIAPTLRLPDEEEELRMYLSSTEITREAGYRRYEISNLSLPGRESRHNLRYWRGEEYLGFGVAAHSCFGGVRFGNGRNMEAFLRGEDITVERYALSKLDELNEYLILNLRLSEGLDTAELRERFGIAAEELSPVLPRLIGEGLMRMEGDRLSFTDRGFFVSNAILSELMREE